MPVESLEAADDDDQAAIIVPGDVFAFRTESPYSSISTSPPAGAAVDAAVWTLSDDDSLHKASRALTAAAAAAAKKKKPSGQHALPQPVLTATSWLQQRQDQDWTQSFMSSSRTQDSASVSSSRNSIGVAKESESWSAAVTAAAAANASATLHDSSMGEPAVVPAVSPATPAATPAAAAAAADDDGKSVSTSIGSFFSSRASMLQQLQQQQVQAQRIHVLRQNKLQLYRYTVAAEGTKIRKRPSQGPISPLRQDSFALTKQHATLQDTNHTPNSSSSSRGLSVGAPVQMEGWAQFETDDIVSFQLGAGTHNPGQDPQQQQQQQQQQSQDTTPLPSYLQTQPTQLPAALKQQHNQQPGSDAAVAAGAETGGTPAAADSPHPSPPTARLDPSRGLCLAVFLYCCSRTQLLSLAWQLGLSPAALRFVSRVTDADVVVHVKPKPRQRHYQYDEFRAQAADKGIPFIDLKSLSMLELQLYLLPVFRLYAGELSPRDLLVRTKRRRYKTRYTNIKLPPA